MPLPPYTNSSLFQMGVFAAAGVTRHWYRTGNIWHLMNTLHESCVAALYILQGKPATVYFFLYDRVLCLQRECSRYR